MPTLISTPIVGNDEDDGSAWSTSSLADAQPGDLLMLVFFGSYSQTGTGQFTLAANNWTPLCDLTSRFRAGPGGYWARLVVWSKYATSGDLGIAAGTISAGAGYGGGFNEWGVQGIVWRNDTSDRVGFVATPSTSVFTGTRALPTLPAGLACALISQGSGSMTPGTWTNSLLTAGGNTLALGRLWRQSTGTGVTPTFNPGSEFTQRALLFSLVDEPFPVTRRRGHFRGRRRS